MNLKYNKLSTGLALLVLVLLSLPQLSAAPRVKIGIDVLAREHPEMVRGKKLAIFTAKTAVDMSLSHSIDRLAKAASVKAILTGDSYFRETMPGESPEIKYDALTNARVSVSPILPGASVMPPECTSIPPL